MLSWWHSVGIYPENELTRNLSGNIRPQSSQPAELLWTDPGIKSGIRVRELIYTKKQQQKNLKQGMNGQTKPPCLLSWCVCVCVCLCLCMCARARLRLIPLIPNFLPKPSEELRLISAVPFQLANQK